MLELASLTEIAEPLMVPALLFTDIERDVMVDRNYAGPLNEGDNIGFRCVRDSL